MKRLSAIKFDNVSFSYDGKTQVLSDYSFTVARGEFYTLSGDNGFGKTTIAKLCDAFLLPNEGTVEVLGTDTLTLNHKTVAHFRKCIGFVFQNPEDQFVASTVFDEVAFGPCNLGLAAEDVYMRVREALATVGLTGFEQRNIATLSGGEKQRVAIADALAMKPELLILDEPASMLDEQGREELESLLQKLNEEGMTILRIAHEETSHNEGSRMTLGLSLAQAKPAMLRILSRSSGAAETAYESSPDTSTDLAIIKISNIDFKYSSNALNKTFGIETEPAKILDNFSLDIFEGESIAITGRNGSGKSTLLQLMNGLLLPSEGEVLIDGVATSSKNGANHARTIVGLCPQFPERALFSDSVYKDIAFAPRNQKLAKDVIDTRVRDAMNNVGLEFEKFKDRHPLTLSGGEQRKVAIASTIAANPKALAFDEPFAGLDAKSRASILETFAKLIEDGKTIILVTHNARDAELTQRCISLS